MWTVQQPGWWNPRCSEFVHTLFAYGMPTFGQKMSYRTIWKSSSHLRITLSWSRHISQNCFELSQRIRIRNVRGSEWRFSYLVPALWLVDKGSWTHRSRFIILFMRSLYLVNVWMNNYLTCLNLKDSAKMVSGFLNVFLSGELYKYMSLKNKR